MLKQQIKRYINLALEEGEQTIALHDEMKDYAKKHQLLPDNMTVVTKDKASRFSDAYIERCEKGTFALVLVEIPMFLNEQIEHLQKHPREFVYVESESFRLLGVDAVSLEFDETTEMYQVKLGLKVRQQDELPLRAYLENNLDGDKAIYHIAFSEDGGLWNVQFPLNALAQFQEEMTLSEAYEHIYRFLFAFVETIEAGE